MHLCTYWDEEWVPFDVDSDPTTDRGDVWGFAPMKYAAGDLNIPLKTGTKDLTSSASSRVEPRRKGVIKTKKRGIALGEDQKDSGELWYIFQLVDTLIDILETSLKSMIYVNAFQF